ncbi:hypothetical protein [Micromonospora sp. NPDC047134]|uniref:hypothetical protein n=1 Tax=Micromonospora sp. NPDC047134 TaxID=3154340 RepID=UPI0033D7811C
MRWNTIVRQTHRWISVTFVVTVIAAFVAATRAEPVEWVFYLPLLPLAVLLLTGLYLFVLPYAVRRRRATS